MVSALMIPVFLLLTALVVDVGNWFTHNRQLQNRADAAAFAAGVEYAKNWKACVQTGNAGPEGRARRARSRMRRGSTRATPRRPTTRPARCRALRNTEIANQANLDVVDQLLRPELHERHGLHRRRRGRGRGPVLQPHSGDRLHLARRRAVDGRQGQGAQPPVHLRRNRAAALARRRPGARRDPAGNQRAPVPAARGAEQRDREGAGALLQRVHGRRDRQREDRPRAAPCGRPVGASSRRAAGRCGRRRTSSGAGDKSLGVNLTLPAATTRRAATTCRSGRRSGSRAAPRSTSTRRARNSSRPGTPTASTGSRRSASGTTATRTPSRG